MSKCLEKSDSFETPGKPEVRNLVRIDENTVLSDVEFMKREEIAQKNRMLVRNLSGSDSYDKLSGDAGEGWNLLPVVNVETETETERLLNSRCGSYTSSSVRTVDSLTNVTRMTVSSNDLSESSKTNDSISSVSSIQSSLSSTSSEEFEDSGEYEQQWHNLWKRHYEEEYLEHYNKFMKRLGEDETISIPPIKIKREKKSFCCDDSRTGSSLSNIMSNLKVDQNECGNETEGNEIANLTAMGLPTFFGKQRKQQSGRRNTVEAR